MLVKQRLVGLVATILLVVVVAANLVTLVNSNAIENMMDSGFVSSSSIGGRCEPLNTDLLPICKDLPYNETQFPNFMKQRSQLEASRDTDVYLPFIRINCSPVLKLFVCSLYAPPCIRNYSSGLIRPCREMCEKAKSGCDVFMQRYQFAWPDYMDCSRFPSFNGPEVCVNDDYSIMSGPQSQHQLKPASSSFPLTSNGLSAFSMSPSSPPKTDNNFLSNLTPQQQQLLLNSLTSVNNLPGALDVQKLYAAALAAAAIAAVSPTTISPHFRDAQLGFTPATPRIKFVCPPVLQLLTDSKSTYYLQVPISSAIAAQQTSDAELNTMSCGMPCDNHIYDKSEVQFARKWVLGWSSLCFASTLFTILTFIIDRSRFQYPQKPIIFLSGCYMVVSLAYMIGSSSSSTSGNTVLCRAHKNAHMQSQEYLVQGLEQIQCTLLFMMIYYFGMSACIWWVILTFTWLLAAALKWAHEGIEKYACYFHIAAWGLPCGQMIIALWMQKVDADVLSGVCYTGIRDMNSLRGFVLAPFIIYLLLGFVFLIVGFVSLYRIKNTMKMEGNRTAKLEQFVLRLFLFSITYMLFAIVFVMCLFNETNKYGSWIEQWLRRNSVEFNLPPDYVANSLGSSSLSNQQAQLSSGETNTVYWLDYWMLMGKYASVLAIGTVSGCWIWTTKTFVSWLSFFDRLVSVWIDVFKGRLRKEAAV